MASTNVQFDTPNLAIYLHETSGSTTFRCYSLYHATAPTFPNSLVVKDGSGTLITPTFPTDTSIASEVLSLDFNGWYFYSLQALLDGTTRLGSILTKWEIDSDNGMLVKVGQKLFSGNYFFNAMAVEYYKFKLSEPAARGSRTVRLRNVEDKTGASRLRIGDFFMLMPNDAGSYFYSQIDTIVITPTYVDIMLVDELNDDYGSLNQCMGERSIYLFDGYGDRSGAVKTGKLYELDSWNLNVTATYSHGAYMDVTAAAFGLINQVPYINQSTKSPCLCFYRGLGIRVQEMYLIPSGILTATFNTENYSTDLTTPLPIYDMCIRSDDPDNPSNTPEFYRVQKAWRDDRTTAGTFSKYNYINTRVTVENMFMNLAFEPQYIMTSGIATVRCYLTNNYGFSTDPDGLPSPPQVKWTILTGDGTFLDGASTTIDIYGIATNRYRGGPTRINPTEQIRACVVTAAGGTC